MSKKTIKIILLAIFINLLPITPALANYNLVDTVNSADRTFEAVAADVAGTAFSVAKGQPYDEANDPAFKSFQGGPTDTSPLHGYFAVPLLVIGVAAIFIFFMKND